MKRLGLTAPLLFSALASAETLDAVKPATCELDTSNVYAQQLTAGWIMNCQGGSTVPDITGNGHTMTLLNGAVCTNIDAVHGEVYVGEVDGSDSVGLVLDAEDLDGGTALTLWAMVKPTIADSASNQQIMRKFGPSTDSYNLQRTSGENASVTFRDVTNSSSSAQISDGLDHTDWTSLLASIDVSGAGGPTSIYVIRDGLVLESATSTADLTSLAVTPHDLRIGNNEGGNGSFYGYITTAYLFKGVALSATDAQSLHVNPWQLCKSGVNPVIYRRRADGY